MNFSDAFNQYPAGGGRPAAALLHQSTDGFAPDHAQDVLGIIHIKDQNINFIVTADGGCIRVHNSQLLLEYFVMGNLLIFDGIRIFDRIFVVNAVHIGGFQNHIGIDFRGAQCSGRISGKIGIARPTGKNIDPPLLKMTDGAFADISFGDLTYSDRKSVV